MDDSSPESRPGSASAREAGHDRWQEHRRQLALREAQAAEDAWELGTLDAQEEKTPFGEYASAEGTYSDYFFDSREARAGLAVALGLGEGADDPAMEAAAHAYADAYDTAACTEDDALVFPLPYAAGQEVTTAREQHGYVTGNSNVLGHPVIEFDDGTRSAVPRSAILAPLVFQFEDHAAAADAASESRVLQDGDVLLAGRAPDAFIRAGTGGGLLPASAWASLDQEQYAASIRLAQKYAGVVPPAPPAAKRRPEPSHRARRTTRPGRDGTASSQTSTR